MRFAIYVGILIAIIPLVFSRPFFGLCAYLVVSILQPKYLCWQPDFQDAFLVGLPLVIGAVAIGVKRHAVRPVRDGRGQVTALKSIQERAPLFEMAWPLLVLGLLIAYIGATRPLSGYPLAETSSAFRSLCKVLIVTAILTGMCSEAKRFRILYGVVAVSAAFWAIKGGLKVALLGPHQVYGKTYDNNLFALTSAMALPMLFYFGQSLKRLRWRWLFAAGSGLTCLAILGSGSRAGFVALAVVLWCMAWSSKYRFRAIMAVFLFVSIVYIAAGDEVRDRVASIINFQEDKSASSRFVTWTAARDMMASRPVFGVGFGNFETARKAAGGGGKAAHNIFLEAAAELGIFGLMFWLLLVLGSIFSLWRFMRWSRRLPADLKWAYLWSRGLLLGLVAFCVHGLFHNEEFLELMLTIIGMNVALQAATHRTLRERRLRRSLAGAGTGLSASQAASNERSIEVPGDMLPAFGSSTGPSLGSA